MKTLLFWVALFWTIVLTPFFAPWPVMIFIEFCAFFLANVAFIVVTSDRKTWRQAFNECALGWCVIGLFILAIGELA